MRQLNVEPVVDKLAPFLIDKVLIIVLFLLYSGLQNGELLQYLVVENFVVFDVWVIAAQFCL